MTMKIKASQLSVGDKLTDGREVLEIKPSPHVEPFMNLRLKDTVFDSTRWVYVAPYWNFEIEDRTL